MPNSLIILHGALGAQSQFIETMSNFGQSSVYTFDFKGHGMDQSDLEFSIHSFSEQLKEYIELNNLDNVKIFGYSMGGYVALFCASMYPSLISEIHTLGTKFHWTPDSAAKEIRMLDPEKIEQKVPAFAEYLYSLHAGKWKKVMQKTAKMMSEMGDHPPLTRSTLSHIEIPVILHLGELDTMVTVEETRQVQENLLNSEMIILSGVKHPINNISSETIIELIKKLDK